MSSFGRQFSNASPVLTMSSQPVHHSPFSAAGFAHQHVPSSSPMSNMSTLTQSASQPRPSGRKRSRDEASINLDPPSKPQDREENWVYGPGMVLIKADAGYVADASSQSGTWLEEKLVKDEETRRQNELPQPEHRCHKLQRVDQPVICSNTPPAEERSPAFNPSSSTTLASNTTPIIDKFTLCLGIGWRQIRSDEHIQAATRGWARYIENHYPISNAHIRLESKGLQSYLVEASEGFFLFAENLRQGQFVSSTVEGALRNLQTSPPSFDDSNVLFAADSPPPVSIDVSDDADMKLD